MNTTYDLIMNTMLVILFFVMSSFVTGLFFRFTLSNPKNIPIIIYLGITVGIMIAMGINLIYIRSSVSIYYIEYALFGGIIFSSLSFTLFYKKFIEIGLINTKGKTHDIINKADKEALTNIEYPSATIKVKVANMLVHTYVIYFLQKEEGELRLDNQDYYGQDTEYMPEKSDFYISYNPKIQSIDIAKLITQQWCIIRVFNMIYKADPNMFESFGSYILQRSKETSSLNVFDELPFWIKTNFNIDTELS